MSLVEREQQLTELGAAHDDARRGEGQVVLVDGGVASGKTELLNVVARQAADAGALVLTTAGSRAENTIGFGMIGQLWHSARAQGQDLPDVANPADAGARPAGPDTHTLGHDDAKLLESVCQVLLDLAADRPLVLLADDVQFADSLSLQAFLYLQRRIRAARVLLVLSGCLDALPAGSAFRAELTRQPHCRHLRTPPLSRNGIRRVLADRITPAAARHAAAVHVLSGGSPVLVHGLVEDYLAARAAPEDAADLIEPVVGEAYVQAALSCLHRSDPRLLDVARGLAVLGSATRLDTLAALSGLKQAATRQVLGVLSTAGLTDGEAFPHPAVRAAVLADCPPDVHARLRLRAAELLHDDVAAVSEVAVHLVAAGEPVAPWAVGVLVAAAEEALAAGHHEEAVDCLELALTGTDDPARRAAVETVLVRAHWCGKPAGVPRHLTSLLAAVRAEALGAAGALSLAGDLAWHGRTEESAEVLARLGDLAAHPDPDLAADYHVTRAWLWYCRPDGSARDDSARDDSAKDERVGVEHMLQRARVGRSPLFAVWQALRALVHADELVLAGDWCEQLREEAAACSATSWLAVLSDVQAAIALRRGDLAAAARHARAALSVMPPGAWGIAIGSPLAHLVLATTMSGEFAEAEEAVRRTTPRAMRESLFWLQFLHARGVYYDAVNRPHAALTEFTTAGEHARRWGADHPGALPWRVDLARVHLRMGRAALARDLVTEHLAGPGADSPRTRGMGLRVLASAYPLKQRRTMLRQAVDLLHMSGDRHEFAHVFADLAATSQALGELGRAKMMGRRAMRLAEGCHAEPLCRRLRSLYDEPDGQDDAGPDVLSTAERRVVNLAARGHTNREIGHELFITVSTVEQHLTRAYRKLNVSGRTDLVRVGPLGEACA